MLGESANLITKFNPTTYDDVEPLLSAVMVAIDLLTYSWIMFVALTEGDVVMSNFVDEGLCIQNLT